jgi:CrcB protein
MTQLAGAAQRLTVILGEDDTWRHKPLYSEIVHRAHRAGLAGASVFRGIEGFGASSRIHTSRLLSLSEDLPVAVVIVDTAERIAAFLPPRRRAGHRGRRPARRRARPPLRRPPVPAVTWLWLSLGAAVGAPARYLTDRLVQRRHDSLFPWGTLVVNVVGSLVLGVTAGVGTRAALPTAVTEGLGAGFCGALTTYSTFGYETVRLAEDGARLLATLNVVVTLAAGLGAAALGYVGGSAL